MSYDSSEEFQDAVDTLTPLPLTTRPNDFGIGTPRIPLNSGVITPFSKMDINPQSSRRSRLAVLRNRMQSEFGTNGTGIGGGNFGTDDDISQSERTSLASWGRNFLMERSNDSNVIAVCPADSQSTKALPIMTNPIIFDRSSNSSFGYVPELALNPTNNNVSLMSTTFVQEKTTIPAYSFILPSSPPPMPPPLPERPVSSFLATNSSPPPIPPPLPPRKAKPVENAPPTVTKPLKLNVSTSEDKTKIHEPPTLNNSHSCEDSSKSSGSNTPSNGLNLFGKKRGHVKTNSLDRGLTLAKTMKSGPFPPPQSAPKSNSLNRGCSPNEMLAIGGSLCEEDQAAQTVIEQITDSILSNCETDDDHSIIETGEIQKLERQLYPSKGANTELMAVGEESSATSTPTKPAIFPEQLNILTEIPLVKKTVKPQMNMPMPRYENLHPLEQSSEELINEPCSSIADTSSTYPISSERTVALLSQSIDPITRDVERRMSVKDQHSVRNQENALEVENDGHLNLHTGIEHAKNVVKSYGTMAGEFFRGAFTRAKKTIGNSNPPKALSSKDEDDDVASVSDEGTASVSDNIPPSQQPATLIQKPSTTEPEIICRPKNAKKGPYDFDQLRIIQELNNEHTGAVWVVKFSVCGRLLATAGQDNIVRVWVLKNHLNHFSKVRERLNQQTNRSGTASTSGLGEELQYAMQDLENAVKIVEDKKSATEFDSGNQSTKSPDSGTSPQNGLPAYQVVMAPKPFCTYRGHTADVLDLSWSKNYFILSCGMDRTVRLWHLARSECLCCFQHMDFVTCIAFMPKDDRYFISGSMDGKIRLWHIPEKKVALWNEVEQVKFITAITFVRNGKFVVVGTYNGRCFFYTTDQLKYHTVIDVRSTRGKNARGHKITSLAVHGDKLLVTSNDSRIRMYDLRDMDLTCKFKGAQIEQSQIRASFSPDGKHIISGSEDNYIYIWRAQDFSPSLTVRKDRNPMWERAKVHNSVVTAAIFAPKPQLFLSLLEDQQRSMVTPGTASGHNENLTAKVLKRMDSDVVSSLGALPLHIPSIADSVNVGGSSALNSTISQRDRQLQGDIIVSADLTGCIKILANPSRIKTGSSHFFTTDYS